MTTYLRTLTLALAATLAMTAAAGAQTRTTSSSTTLTSSKYNSAQNYMLQRDATYDFALYAAAYETHWYVVAVYKNGNVVETMYTSQSSAQSYANWLSFHIAELDTAYVEARYELGEFVYWNTYDKLADAQYYAALLESLGLETQIHWVSEYQYFTAPLGSFNFSLK